MRAAPFIAALLPTMRLYGRSDLSPAITDIPSAWRFADTRAGQVSMLPSGSSSAIRRLIRSSRGPQGQRKYRSRSWTGGRVRRSIRICRAMCLPAGRAEAGAKRGRYFKDGLYLGRCQLVDCPKRSWQIDLFGGLRRATQAARADLLSTREARRGVLLTVIGEVATGYIHLRTLDEELAITQRTATSRKESYDLFTHQFERGVISELELRQAESEYEQALAAIPQLEKDMAQQENNLSVLLAKNPGRIPRGKGLRELAPPSVPALMPSSVLRERPDIRQAEQDLIAANARVGVAYANYFPALSLTGLFGWGSTELQNLVHIQASSGIMQDPLTSRSLSAASGTGRSAPLKLFIGRRWRGTARPSGTVCVRPRTRSSVCRRPARRSRR